MWYVISVQDILMREELALAVEELLIILERCSMNKNQFLKVSALVVAAFLFSFVVASWPAHTPKSSPLADFRTVEHLGIFWYCFITTSVLAIALLLVAQSWSEKALDVYILLKGGKLSPCESPWAGLVRSGLGRKARRIARLSNKSARIRKGVENSDDKEYQAAEKAVKDAQQEFWGAVTVMRVNYYTDFGLKDVKSWREALKF